MDKMRRAGGKKMSVFVQDQGIKNVHAGGNNDSVHVIVECPLNNLDKIRIKSG